MYHDFPLAKRRYLSLRHIGIQVSDIALHIGKLLTDCPADFFRAAFPAFSQATVVFPCRPAGRCAPPEMISIAVLVNHVFQFSPPHSGGKILVDSGRWRRQVASIIMFRHSAFPFRHSPVLPPALCFRADLSGTDAGCPCPDGYGPDGYGPDG